MVFPPPTGRDPERNISRSSRYQKHGTKKVINDRLPLPGGDKLPGDGRGSAREERAKLESTGRWEEDNGTGCLGERRRDLSALVIAGYFSCRDVYERTSRLPAPGTGLSFIWCVSATYFTHFFEFEIAFLVFEFKLNILCLFYLLPSNYMVSVFVIVRSNQPNSVS